MVKKNSTLSETTKGYVFALTAFAIWGAFPLYWNMLAHVDAIEILSHRIIWTLPICIAILLWSKKFKSSLLVFKQPQIILLLCFSTIFIASNWGIYIWAVTNDAVVQASIGYFLNPLVSVMLGLVIFKEKLRLWQWVAIGIACFGVIFAVIYGGQIPFIGMFLAVSFGLYGAIRKFIPVGSVHGLFIETLLISPIAIGYLIWLDINNISSFLNIDIRTDIILIGAGMLTAIPLFSYVAAARILPISTVGMLFYITPSILFFLAIFLYGENVTLSDYIVFGCIWLAIAIFTIERHNNAKKNRETVI